MKSESEHAREIANDLKEDAMWSVIVLIKQRDAEVRNAAIRECVEICDYFEMGASDVHYQAAAGQLSGQISNLLTPNP